MTPVPAGAVASSVDCHDAGPVDLRDAGRQLALYPRTAAIKRFDWQYHTCRFWSSGEAPAAFLGRLRAARDCAPWAGPVPDSDAPVFAALLRDDVDLPEGSACYALLVEHARATLAASDLIA